MLFIIDHRHTAMTCPAGKIHHEDDFMQTLDAQAKKSGLKIVEGYLDGPGHQFYFIAEADNAKQILEFSVPLIKIGETKVSPVLKWSEATSVARNIGLLK
jgi:uncharacterized protein DUF3303